MPPKFHFAPKEDLDSHTEEEGCDHKGISLEVNRTDPAPFLWSRVVYACSRISNENMLLLRNKDTRPKHAALEELVMECYHKKDITKLFLIYEYRNDQPASLSPSSSEKEFKVARAFQSFSSDFQGKHHLVLLNTLDSYMSGPPAKSTIRNYSIPLVQSSCTGKSRLLDEVIRLRAGCMLNLREDLIGDDSTYPHPDTEVRKYFREHKCKTVDDLKSHYSAFLCSLFAALAVKISEFAEHAVSSNVDLANQLHNFLGSGTDYQRRGQDRTVFLDKVVKNAENKRDGFDESELHKLGRSLTRRIESRYQQPGNGVKFILVFDEAHVLGATDEGMDRSRLDALDHVLTWLKPCSIFVVFMSTNTKFEELAPPREKHPSWRDGSGWYPFPPLTEFAQMDLHVGQSFAVPEGISLASACAPSVVTRFGRPQWHALFNSMGHDIDHEDRLQSVVDFAVSKLTPRMNKDATGPPEAHLAWFSWLVMMHFDQGSAEARQLESRLVESYMRVVHVVPSDRSYMRSGTPSEPMLAEAAAQLLNQESCNIPAILAGALDHGLVAKGERGEIVARALLMQASMRATMALPSLHGCLRHHRPMRVLDFLKALFTPDDYERVVAFKPIACEDNEEVPTLQHAFRNAWLHFSHFALAGDYKVIRRKHLPSIMLRGAALQAFDNQVALDGVMGILFDDEDAMDVDEPHALLCEANVSALQWQVKNMVEPKFSVLPWHHTDPNGTAEGRPILSLFLSLGAAKAAGQDNVFRAVQVARNTRSGNKTPQHRHYQINVRGLEAYQVWTEADRSTIRAALAVPRYFDDFARSARPENVELLDGCLPLLKYDNVSTNYVS